jgi:Tol biopolymer transport system component
MFPRAAALALALALAAAAPGVAQYQQSFGKNKVQYREFDWKIYHSPHFDIYYYEAEAALLEKVVSFAETAYDRLSREFDHQIDKPIPLIFYATHSAFEQNNIILNFIPEGIGAFATAARNRMVMPVDLPDAELLQLISHELTHVFQYSLLYGDRLGRGLQSMAAPQWFTEGMASYMAKDEGTADKMFLRDAVVTDRIPSIVQSGVSGFLAYRFGHAAFDFIEERWGRDGFRDFLYEFRNTLGSRPERALERALKIDPEDFDLDFRRWLRKKYLPQLVETGEPSDFGRPFRDEEGKIVDVISPAASPSGDLVAALAVTRGDLDIVLYDARKRRAIGNLTKGYTNEYVYIVSQYVTSKGRMGRDLAFSPDGNRLAVFVKRERGRSLAIFDMLERKLERMIEMDVEQQNSPAFSPDGGKVAFSGNTAGRFDIFSLDLASGEVVNLTDDERYDGAPVYSPDGASIVYSSTVGEDYGQLFQLDLADPSRRTQLTRGKWTDKDATFSSDGSWLVFTSDRSGADNIWAMELASGLRYQITNVITGCLMPTVLKGEEGRDRVVYAGLWRGDFDLYVEDLDKAKAMPVAPEPAAEPPVVEPEPTFEPDIRVTIDEANKDDYGGFKLFLEDGGGSVGVTDDQLILGQAYLSFSDYLGDRRLQVVLSTVDTFSDFDIQYLNLSGRSYWGLRLFDYRDYYVLGRQSPATNLVERKEASRTTALLASWGYPFSLYHRVELGAGAYSRSYTLIRQNPLTGEFEFFDVSDDAVPLFQVSLTGDSAVNTRWGPISGGRWRLSTRYGLDTDEGGTLDWRTELDARRYLQVSERTNLALRLFAGYADGNRSSFFYLGGLDTLRGFDFRSILGDRAFVANVEYRFPLIDALVGPFFDFRGIRGRIFLDVGGAWFEQFGEQFEFWDSDQNRLADALSAYGWGLTIRFGGIDLNWDFARRWDFKDGDPEGFSTSFWIGSRF